MFKAEYSTDKNIKTFFEREKEVLNKWKGILDRKSQYYQDVEPKLIYIFNVISIKIKSVFF